MVNNGERTGKPQHTNTATRPDQLRAQELPSATRTLGSGTDAEIGFIDPPEGFILSPDWIVRLVPTKSP